MSPAFQRIFPLSPEGRFESYLLPKRRILFLGAFAKLRKATISFVMSVRPSVRMEQLGFH
jgi:hypothetical protein